MGSVAAVHRAGVCGSVMPVFVTGANGFIRSRVVRQLVDSGTSERGHGFTTRSARQTVRSVVGWLQDAGHVWARLSRGIAEPKAGEPADRAGPRRLERGDSEGLGVVRC